MAEKRENSKPVIVRVKRKSDQSPLQALWLEISERERPLKRPLLDFQKLSISDSTSAPPQEELKIKRVLVQHVETLSSSQATIDFLQSFGGSTSCSESKFKASSKERRRTLDKENKHNQLLAKAKQELEDLGKSARFEQIWKQRGRKEAIHDEAVDEVCRVYDVLRVDVKDAVETVKQEEISVEDQETLSKFLPLLKECIPSAAEEIESDIHSHPLRQDSADEYVYDLYTIKEKIDETEEAYPFPLVQVEDDDDMFYDGPDDPDYETDDSNAEDNPLNDYPEEESSECEEEESESCGSEPEEDESDTESDRSIRSDDSEYLGQSEDLLSGDEMDDMYNDPEHGYYEDGENSRWD